MRKLVVPFMTLVLGLTFASAADAQQIVTKPPTLKLSDPLPGNLFVELAKAINPAVVNISTSTLPRNMARDPFWDQLEQFYGMRLGPRQRSNKPMQTALGTGFVIREDGLIVTNAHVVRMADIVTVQFDEGSDKTYDAKVVGSDERSDIALLKIQADKKLPVAPLGSSADTEVGEWVAAFGNPFGHGHSVTKGIISSKARALEEINKFPLLQTDAAINPGNSGGPLVNSKGLVIGVNSAIDARAQGIGFAIPIDEVKRILPELEKSGRLGKGYLGVGLGDIVSNYEGDESEDESLGAVIVAVEKGGPAEKAGIRYGDKIVAFNGKKIHSAQELSIYVSDSAPGDKVTMKVMRQEGRKTKELTLTATVADRPDKPSLGSRGGTPAPKGQKAPGGLGFSVTDLNAGLRAELGLPEDLKKPVVTQVDPNTVAAFVGIRPGDVLLEVNKTEVSTAKDVTDKLKKGENIIKLARGNRIIIVSVK